MVLIEECVMQFCPGCFCQWNFPVRLTPGATILCTCGWGAQCTAFPFPGLPVRESAAWTTGT